MVSQTSADATGDTKATAVMDIATARKDCVTFISPARADVVNVANAVTQTQNVVAFADGLYHHQVMLSLIVVTNKCTTNTMIYSDLFHSNGDIARTLCARTDNVADPHFSTVQAV